jgi:hypothetical protein
MIKAASGDAGDGTSSLFSPFRVHETRRASSSATGALQGGDVTGVMQLARDRALREILTRQQVAELLQVRPRQVERLGVPCLDLGRKTKRYMREEVLAWLEAQSRRTGAKAA